MYIKTIIEKLRPTDLVCPNSMVWIRTGKSKKSICLLKTLKNPLKFCRLISIIKVG